jgi:ubiquinone/menaquinone biosynthesis C-methylase UbiE
MNSSPEGDGRLSSKTAVEYFDSHAEYYDKNQYQTTRRTFVNGRHEQIVAILSSLRLKGGASVLDAGCGPGNLVPAFASRFAHVCAMDASPRMLQVAKSSAAQFHNVNYQVGSIEALPFADGTFDVVCSSGVIEYLRNCDRAIEEMHRVLRPDGVLILPTTNVLAPVHWISRGLAPISRIPAVAKRFGLQPGSYKLWYHFIPSFRARLRAAGFTIQHERYFYLTLPRPLDRIFPHASRRLERHFDRYMTTRLRHLAEGYIAVARKPAA